MKTKKVQAFFFVLIRWSTVRNQLKICDKWKIFLLKYVYKLFKKFKTQKIDVFYYAMWWVLRDNFPIK